MGVVYRGKRVRGEAVRVADKGGRDRGTRKGACASAGPLGGSVLITTPLTSPGLIEDVAQREPDLRRGAEWSNWKNKKDCNRRTSQNREI